MSRQPPVDPDDIVHSASERLALSRESLRRVLTDASRSGPRIGHAGQEGKSTPAWLEFIQSLPGVKLVLKAASSWWNQHPLHDTGMAVGTATRALLANSAQRNPVGLVVVAVLAGTLISWSRPWRWLVTPALLAGLLPKLIAQIAARIPLHYWMEAMASAPGQPFEPNDEAQARADQTAAQRPPSTHLH